MTGFNYNSFKLALKKAQEESYAKLLVEIDVVKAHIEKALTLWLECSATRANVSYPGVDI